MATFDSLPRHQFGSVIFPGRTTRLTVAGRVFEHEYPHVKKGAAEKLGAKLRRCTIEIPADSRMPAYPNLYPAGMLQLLAWAESQSTQTLQHRSAGKWPAFIVNYDQLLDSRIRSGEKVELQFLEDTPDDFTADKIAPVNPNQSLSPTAGQLALDLANIRAQLSLTSNDEDLFSALQSVVSDVVAVQDTRELYGNLYAAKIQSVIDMCSQLHDATPSLQDVRAWPVVEDLVTLRALAIGAQQDLTAKNLRLLEYVNPTAQPLLTIARVLYGDASRQSDLLSLNADTVVNPMRVPAGAKIRYYPAST